MARGKRFKVPDKEIKDGFCIIRKDPDLRKLIIAKILQYELPMAVLKKCGVEESAIRIYVKEPYNLDNMDVYATQHEVLRLARFLGVEFYVQHEVSDTQCDAVRVKKEMIVELRNSRLQNKTP
jgi:hypothetical protein